ncbi:MAG: hypothetical protein J1E34_02265 [Oscillospiraceae bacterium]|nr:hypothetical protein [Oscillospiraceae bacterium]
MKKLKLFFIVTIIAVLTCAFAVSCFAASFSDSDGGIIGIANRGLWTEYPENSLEGILAAADTGIGYVLADVSETADGVPVLMEKKSAKRMLGTEKENVSVYSYSELAALPLKNRVGGKGNETTEYHISTLENALNALSGFKLVLKFDCSLTDKIVSAVDEPDNIILYITGKTKEVLSKASEYGENFNIIAEKQSNIIFSVMSFIDSMSEAGAKGAVLKTSNRYGVIFYNSTLNKCQYLRAVSDTGSPETAGYREDTVKWWDDLISRGYSAVITNDPEAFVRYIDDNNTARERLSYLYGEVQKMNIPDFGSSMLSDYKKAYNDSMTKASQLLEDNSSSLGDMLDCYASLSKAVKDIQMNFEEIENGTAGVTVTIPRIVICVIAAAVVIIVQIYFYKRRKS